MKVAADFHPLHLISCSFLLHVSSKWYIQANLFKQLHLQFTTNVISEKSAVFWKIKEPKNLDATSCRCDGLKYTINVDEVTNDALSGTIPFY